MLSRVWRFLLFLHFLWAQGSDLEAMDIDQFLGLDGVQPATQDTTHLAAQTPQTQPFAEDTLLEKSKPLPPLRLIDSPRYRRLTLDERTNQKIRTNAPFRVQIIRPRLQNTKGHPLRYGFDEWYLYIVRAEEVRIEGKVLRTSGLPIYLAIISLSKSLPDELPTVLESPALMLKGIVDYGDTIVKHFKQERARLEKVLDSLSTLAEPPEELAAEAFRELIRRTKDSLEYAAAHYELYRAFKRARGSGQGLLRFFLSFPFNRDLNYSLYAAPYALPRYDPPSAGGEPPASAVPK